MSSAGRTIRRITLDDLDFIDENALDINKEEVLVVSGGKISERLKSSPVFFENTDVLVVDGKIIGLGGFMETEYGCVVWMMATKYIYDHAKAFFLTLMRKFKELQEKHEYIFSYVYSKNTITQDWLTKMGFAVHDPEPYGINGEEFCLFDWRKNV